MKNGFPLISPLCSRSHGGVPTAACPLCLDASPLARRVSSLACHLGGRRASALSLLPSVCGHLRAEGHLPAPVPVGLTYFEPGSTMWKTSKSMGRPSRPPPLLNRPSCAERDSIAESHASRPLTPASCLPPLARLFAFLPRASCSAAESLFDDLEVKLPSVAAPSAAAETDGTVPPSVSAPVSHGSIPPIEAAPLCDRR